MPENIPSHCCRSHVRHRARRTRTSLGSCRECRLAWPAVERLRCTTALRPFLSASILALTLLPFRLGILPCQGPLLLTTRPAPTGRVTAVTPKVARRGTRGSGLLARTCVQHSGKLVPVPAKFTCSQDRMLANFSARLQGAAIAKFFAALSRPSQGCERNSQHSGKLLAHSWKLASSLTLSPKNMAKP